jgi:glycosyltransferase involved in cell wall biosynthesis
MQMSAEPKISVIIPAYNAARFIRRTIDSVLAQSFSDYEIIIIDDGSTDDTAEIVKSCGDKVKYIYQKNAGDGPARNTGIAAAKGEWLAFLDHDDQWLPEKLQLQMELLNKNPDLRWCAGNFYRQIGDIKSAACDYDTMQKTLGNRPYLENLFTAMAQKQAVFMTSTMVVHRQAFEKAGLFDSCWLRCADTDMWWRIAFLFPQIGYLPEPLAILHLDVQDSVGTNLRLQTKRGEDDRKLIARHLKLAEKYNRMDTFRPCAKNYLRKCLLITIYYGFKADARAMASQFRDLLGRRWLMATYILTIFPKAVSALAQTLVTIANKLGIEREMSRRWITPRKNQESEK